MGSDHDTQAGEECDGEGPISAEDLEGRNTERTILVISDIEELDLTVSENGLRMSEGQIEKATELTDKLIVLLSIGLLIIVFWRMGTVMRLVAFLA